MKPNIIFVFADQMRSSAMGCAGEDVITPNFDEFAKGGIRFTRAVSNTPVCSPARASIISGLHTLTHELVCNDKPLRTDIKSLAHCLNEAGYKCGYVGKWHMDCADRGVFVPPGPRRQGFDDFWASYNCNHRYFNGYYYLNDSSNPIWVDGYEPDGQTDIAIGYIDEKAKQEDPFCLFLSWGPPHCPYRESPRKYLNMYPENLIKLKPNAVETADKAIIAGYYAHITALDECFGRLLKAVDEKGIRDNTIIIFTSDHGDMLFSQNRGWKGKPWSESVMIPFIVQWPGKIPEDRVSRELISLVDVMPTLLSLTGTDIPREVQGRNMSGVLLGDEDDIQKSVFINYPVCSEAFSYEAWRGIITNRYTYARFMKEPWVLYDDIEDPYQMNNLIGSKEIVEEMEKELDDWLEKLNDPFESSEEVCKKLYIGSKGGVMPYYENEVIKNGINKK